MQPEILIAAAGIIVTFTIATWRWSASQNKRFDQMMQGFQNEIRKFRDENNQQFGKLGDENNRLRSEVRGEIKEVRNEIKEVRGEIKEVRGEIKEVRNEIKEVREDVHRLDNRIARQEGLIRALWAGTFKGDLTSEPAFPE